MRRILLAVVAVGFLSGCSQYKRLIGEEPYSEDIPPCSRTPVQDFTGTDEEVMAQLLFDQENRLDNQAQFFDDRPGAIQQVKDLYNGVRPFPQDAQGFACLDETEFRRVVLASSNLGRFPL